MSWRDVAAKAEGRVESVDDALMGSMSGTGGKQNTGRGLGDQERRNNQVTDDLTNQVTDDLTGEQNNSSMIIDGVDLREPQPPQISSNLQFARTKKIQLLNPDDIRGLAEQNMFPDDLLFDKDSYGSELDSFAKAKLMKRKEEFEAASNPKDKEFLLRKAIEDELSDRKSRKKRDDLMRSKGVAVGAGLATGVLGGTLAYGSGAAAALAAGAAGLKPLLAYLGEYLIPVATTAGKTGVAVGVYEAVTSDPEMTDEELEQTIQTEVRKALEAEEDTGSPPLTEQSADSGQ